MEMIILTIEIKDIFLQSKERYVVKEMEFKKVNIDNITARSYTWLFNDLLLIARRKEKNRYLFRAMISIDLSCSINDLDPNGTGSSFLLLFLLFNFYLIYY